MLRKIKFWAISIILLLTTLGVLFFNLEFIQKKIFDVKADLVGSNRSVTFYSNIDATKVIIIPARIHHIKVLSTQTLPIVKSKGIVQLSTRILLAKASVCISNKTKV